jgi:hypothetical protein
MAVTRAEGFLNEVIHDSDGLVISSTAGTSSTTVVADGIKRLCVDATISGGIPVAPTPNEGAVTFQAFAPGAGIATQGPNQAVPDGFAVVIKNRSTSPTGIVFVANSLANCAIATARLELSKGESASFYITNMDLLFFQCELDTTVAEFYSEV